MFCEKCGKALNETVKFCDECGTPVQKIFGEDTKVEQVAVAPTPVINNFYQEEKREPVSVAGWIFRPFLALIPIAGPIVYLIMLFVWAGSKSKEKSFNNWAKAQLILMLISVIIGVTVGVVVAVIASSGYRGSIRY